MPPTQNDGKVGIPFLDGTGDLYRLANHGTRNERDTQTDSVTHLFEHSLFVVRCDGGVYENDLESSADKRGGHGQDA